MKRFLSLFLALVMSLSLAAPAFAAEPDDPNEGIMPLSQLYSDDYINSANGMYKPYFTTTPNAGKYLRIWFRNKGTETVRVELRDYNTNASLKSKTFAPGTLDETLQYTIPTPDKACSYYLYFESIGPSGARIVGQAAAAQYSVLPN